MLPSMFSPSLLLVGGGGHSGWGARWAGEGGAGQVILDEQMDTIAEGEYIMVIGKGGALIN